MSEVEAGAPGGRSGGLGLRAVLCIFLPFAAGYFLSFGLRNINAVISGDLQADVALTAAQLGLLTSMYFLAFASFQLPLGVLLDRYGPRRVQAVLLTLAAAGCLLFAAGGSVGALSLGRALIGIGVSACLMASFKAFALWFAPQRLALVNGWLLAFGGLGAIAATRPTELVLDGIGWRGVFVVVAAACALVAVAVWWLVPEHEDQQHSVATPLREQLATLKAVFTHPLFWRVAPILALTHGGAVAIHGLWAGPWLRDVTGYDRAETANVLLLIAVAITVGFAGWGTLVTWLRRYRIGLEAVAGAGLVLFMIASLVLVLQIEALAVEAWLVLGVTSTVGTLFFAFLSQHFDRRIVGRVNTGLNLIVFTTAWGVQWGLGIVIESWELADGLGYAAAGYAWSFGLLAAMQLLALIWFFVGPGRS